MHDPVLGNMLKMNDYDLESCKKNWAKKDFEKSKLGKRQSIERWLMDQRALCVFFGAGSRHKKDERGCGVGLHWPGSIPHCLHLEIGHGVNGSG